MKRFRLGVRFVFAVALIAVIAAHDVAQLDSEIGDAENESGSIESENDVGVDGDNNNVCLGILDFENSGNFTNQQAVTIYEDEENDESGNRDHQGDRKHKGGGNEF